MSHLLPRRRDRNRNRAYEPPQRTHLLAGRTGRRTAASSVRPMDSPDCRDRSCAINFQFAAGISPGWRQSAAKRNEDVVLTENSEQNMPQRKTDLHCGNRIIGHICRTCSWLRIASPHRGSLPVRRFSQKVGRFSSFSFAMATKRQSPPFSTTSSRYSFAFVSLCS